jgi:hypothetical protein
MIKYILNYQVSLLQHVFMKNLSDLGDLSLAKYALSLPRLVSVAT